MLLLRILSFLIYSLSAIFLVLATISVFYSQKVVVPYTIHIPKGSISTVLESLEKQLDTSFYKFDGLVLSYFGHPQAGYIMIGGGEMERWEFLKKITFAKSMISNETITLIPGETTLYFLKGLAEKYNRDFEVLKKFWNSISPLKEGFLIPESYKKGDETLEEFLKRYVRISNKIHKERASKFGKTAKEWRKILIIASVIQKESASVEEMPTVASVIYNRLKKKMKLQMDGTLNYGLYSHQRVTPERIRNDKSSYNTYKNRGLPNNPVCNPSLEAIESAVNPAKTDFLYFVKIKGQKRHKFSKSYTEHLRQIERNR
jgi:UPF0755 protein